MGKLYSLRVGMTCSGCRSSVEKILSRIEGVKSVHANLETKRVDVECDDSVDVTSLLDSLKKWAGNSGKSVEIWS